MKELKEKDVVHVTHKPYARSVTSRHSTIFFLETWSEFPQFCAIKLARQNKRHEKCKADSFEVP